MHRRCIQAQPYSLLRATHFLPDLFQWSHCPKISSNNEIGVLYLLHFGPRIQPQVLVFNFAGPLPLNVAAVVLMIVHGNDQLD